VSKYPHTLFRYKGAIMRVKLRAAMAILASAPLAIGSGAAWAHSGPGIVQASSGDLTASCTAGAESGVNFPNSEVEPSVAVNPRNPRQVIGVFQQDRWSDGGAHAGGVVWTKDGTHFSEGLLPFGVCGAPGGTNYERVSDPWVSYGPDGTAYASALGLDAGLQHTGVNAATSFDGGKTWKFAQSVIDNNDTTLLNDKDSITADPLHPGTAYLVWDRNEQIVDPSNNLTYFEAPAYLSITRDYGRTWSTPQVIVNTAQVGTAFTIGNVIVVDHRTGRLYDFFHEIVNPSTTVASDFHYSFVSSGDGGRTWSAPTKVASDTSFFDADPNDPTKVLRTGGAMPSVAIDPVTGELYLAREGSDFTSSPTTWPVDQAELIHSTDGGKTWSAPTQISHGPMAPSYLPSVAVDPNGTVNVTYYDVSDLQPGNTTTLPTSTWLYSFPRGRQQKATEQRLAPDFDWLLAPNAGGYFLGDYQGLAASGIDGVRPFFATTLNAPQTNVYSGAFETPWGDPFAQQNTLRSTAPGPTASPANIAALVRAHTLASKTAY
jgi:hypothetical protein